MTRDPNDQELQRAARRVQAIMERARQKAKRSLPTKIKRLADEAMESLSSEMKEYTPRVRGLMLALALRMFLVRILRDAVGTGTAQRRN